MIADSTFLIHLAREVSENDRGPAREFLARHRREPFRTTIINIAEAAVGFDSSRAAWEFFKKWKIYQLHEGIAVVAADLDRRLRRTGRQLGENDTWVAGFCLYYREPVISADLAFDHVPGLRRVRY